MAPLDNEVVFKKAFTDITVFKSFVHDIVGIDIDVDTIETEKKFSPKVGNIDFAYDIFAESVDHRAVIEMQRVEYDYHFDRFLHYHYMAVGELQTSAGDYKTNREVYTIVILTAPYTIKTIDGLPIQDEVMISSADPRTEDGQIRKIFGHKLFFLNSYHRNDFTPPQMRDWLNLIYASRHNEQRILLNLENEGIKKAVELISYNHLSPVEMKNMKQAEGRKKVLSIMEARLEDSEKQVLAETQRAEEAEQRAEEEKRKAEEEKQKAEEAEQRVEEEKRKAEEEKRKAEEAEKRSKATFDKALAVLMESGLSEQEAKRKLGI